MFLLYLNCVLFFIALLSERKKWKRVFYVKFVYKTIGLVQTLCHTAVALPNLVSQDKSGCVRDDVGFMCDLIMEHNLVMLESKRYKVIAYHCEYFRLCNELRTSQTRCLAPAILSTSQALQSLSILHICSDM